MNSFIESQTILGSENRVAPLGLLLTEGARGLGEKINAYLVDWAESRGQQCDTFIVESECPRFSSGDGKGLIKETIRGMDLFIIVDVGNYSCSYKLFNRENSMSPDDHFQDLKRLIQAASGKAYRINVIMPILYGGRQHNRYYRESLDCACALQELQNMGVANILTFDAHDARVQNAVPLMGLDNIIPYYQVLKTLFRCIPDIDINKDNFMVVSPDEGAMTRNMYYSSVLGVDLGMFYKRRDYSQIVNGRNPIVAHEYLGAPVDGKTVFITDDIIASGESMLDIAYELKRKNAKKIYCYGTYAVFTHGFDKFARAYDEGIISGVLGTNLTYCPEELLGMEWYHQVDVSKYISYFVDSMNHDVSVNSIIDPHEKIKHLLDNRL